MHWHKVVRLAGVTPMSLVLYGERRVMVIAVLRGQRVIVRRCDEPANR